MKKINALLIMLIVFIACPVSTFASSDSSGEEGGGAPVVNPCGNSCSGIQRWSKMAGVRITFVDENGHAVASSGSKSFDFTTYVVDSAEGISGLYYNSYSGDRNKITMAGGGNYSEGRINENDIKDFSAVVAAFNNYVSTTSGHTSSLSTSGNTGGNLSGFTGELEWFLSLTKSTNTSYADDINAFIRAIADVSGGFNAEDLIYEVAQGCQSGEEIFIVMEPIFSWSGKVDGTYHNYFGTLSDSYHFFSGSLVGGATNLNNMAYLIYYEREISAYKGATGVAYHEFSIQSGSDLLSVAGYGLAVDWANDPGLYCNSCSFVNGKFSYDNKLEGYDLVIPSKFGSIQEYAFSSRSEGGAGCCEILKDQLSSVSSEWTDAYKEYCEEEPTNECDAECVPDEPPVINVNNCCEDSTKSEVIESELDDLFCYDSDLQVSYYISKCNSDQYKTTVNDYCDLYCTERVEIEIPGSITATSGRYFKLTTTSQGTTSPYIEGFRRCRVKIYYNEWREDYVEKVKEEVEQFNEYQKQSSIYKTYENAKKIKTVSDSDTITATCTITTTNSSTGLEESKPSTGTATFSYSYDVYEFDKIYSYNTVKLSDNNYSSVKIVNDSKKTESHTKYSLYDYSAAKSAYESAKSTAASNCGGTNVSYSGPSFKEFTDGEYTEENVESKLNEIGNSVETAKSKYQSATNDALSLEEKVDECDYYFTDSDSKLETKGDYAGSNADSYKFSPELTFKYAQAYLNESAESVIDNLEVEFDKSCTYEIITNDNETDVDEIKEDRYSGLYGEGTESMLDFSSSKEITYVEGTLNLSDFYDYEYKASKKFTTDAKYHAVCTWTEKDNTTYTLVPSGLTSATKYDNYTIHNRQYAVYISTYDGTYETYWNIDNIGHNGKLTEYFKNGKTCANETVSSTNTTLTCTIHVEHELVTTGKCNGSNDTNVTVYPEDCDPQTQDIDLFEFKFVDGGELFPSGTTTSEGEIAYNWTSTEEGQKVWKELIEKTASDTIFAPENISYSFVLTPTDMKKIKNYNSEKESTDNGYNDFNLHCDETCGENSVDGSGCSVCKSYFLEDLANGTITYNNTSHSISVWNTSSSIQDIRKNNHWAGV